MNMKYQRNTPHTAAAADQSYSSPIGVLRTASELRAVRRNGNRHHLQYDRRLHD